MTDETHATPQLRARNGRWKKRRCAAWWASLLFTVGALTCVMAVIAAVFVQPFLTLPEPAPAKPDLRPGYLATMHGCLHLGIGTEACHWIWAHYGQGFTDAEAAARLKAVER